MSETLKEVGFSRTKNKVLCTVWITLPLKRTRHLTNCYWASGGRWVLTQGAVHTDELGLREAKCLVSCCKVIITWTRHRMCMSLLAGFWADCEAKALAIHCHYRPSGVLWQTKGVNSRFLATLQFGWLYSCFLKFLPHPTNQFWLFADSPNRLLLLVVEWSFFHPGAQCIVWLKWSQVVRLSTMTFLVLELQDGFLPIPFLGSVAVTRRMVE